MKNIFIIISILVGMNLNAQVWADSLRKAQELYSNQEYSNSLEIYKKAKVNKADEKYLNQELAQSAYRAEDYEVAQSSLELALKSETDEMELARLHYNQGNVCYKKGDYQEAIKNYKLSVVNDPDNSDAKYNLCQALRKQRQQQSNTNKQDNKTSNDEKNPSSKKEPKKKEEEFSLEKQAADRTLDELLKNAQKTKRKISNKSKPRKSKNGKDW